MKINVEQILSDMLGEFEGQFTSPKVPTNWAQVAANLIAGFDTYYDHRDTSRRWTRFTTHEDKFYLDVEVPGFVKEDFEVTLEPHMNSSTKVKYVAKREDARRGPKTRQGWEMLPASADPETLRASVDNGILTIVVEPKQEKPKESNVKKVTIT